MFAVPLVRPLSTRVSYQSIRLDDFSSYLSGAYCTHRVFKRGRGGAVDARHHRVSLGNISLNYLQYGAEVEIDPGLFETFYMLELPVSGWVDLDHCGKTVRNQTGFATILSPTEPVRSIWSQDCGQRMIKISRATVERQVGRMLGRAITEPVVFDTLIDLSREPGGSIVRLCNFLFDQYEMDPGLFGERRVSEEIENALITLLLLGQPNNYSGPLAASNSGAVPRHVRRALDYIEQNLREEISIEAVIEASAVSARALYAGFERFVGTPPQLYIRNRRLDGVRGALSEACAPTTVSELALEWGFTHLGRFSSEYRRRFGELPSDTLRR
ncbi:AraC family transcriptional regulator [Flavisphingomonas formosensis]|uniref:AraC family transcriptional regulator n=1 Tax=Flavisphingomonas formosensis TaxID=861534 RepID=UPI0012FB3832|nr:AraC family transcriptional regulator [Sphingomonas formosensis]